MRIRYFDRQITSQPKVVKHENGVAVVLDADTDCMTITLPSQEGQPELEVTVNTDVVQVHCDGRMVAMHSFADMLAEAD